MNDDSMYQRLLQECRTVRPSSDLTDRIMAAIASTSPENVTSATFTLANSGDFKSRSIRPFVTRLGPALLWTAASLIFLARLTALVGNLVFPTNSYPEFAVDEREHIGPHDEHGQRFHEM